MAGATRGAGRGIAVGLGAEGATVYATGRSTRDRRSEVDRPETIEETAELVTAAGGTGIAVVVDHLVSDEVRALVARIEAEQGRLDVLVNDVWGAEHLFEWDTPVWEHDLEQRAAAGAAGARDPPHHQPPRAGAADRAPRWSADRGHRRDGRVQRRALPQLALLRPGQERGDQAGVGAGPRARAARRHRRRADARMAALGGDARGLRRHRGDVARGGHRGFRTSAARSRPPSSVAPPRPWPPIPRWRAGTGSRCRAVPSRRSTASPTSTAPGPMRGATSSR